MQKLYIPESLIVSSLFRFLSVSFSVSFPRQKNLDKLSPLAYKKLNFDLWHAIGSNAGSKEVEKKIRIMVAKPGLDGHDRGAKVVAQALRDAGMEVIYTGLHQTVDQITRTAIQEGVDVIGLSIMSGAHLPICEKLMKEMKKKKIDDIMVVIGGVIPKRDIPSLQKIGIQGIFPGGTPFDESIQWIKDHLKTDRG